MKFGCKARFTALECNGALVLKSLYLMHNHICNQMLVSAYPKYRRFEGEAGHKVVRMIRDMRPSAGRLKVFLKSKDCINHNIF